MALKVTPPMCCLVSVTAEGDAGLGETFSLPVLPPNSTGGLDMGQPPQGSSACHGPLSLGPGPRVLSFAPPPESGERVVQTALTSHAGCRAGPRPASYRSCGLGAKGVGWGGRPPSLFTRTRAAISSSNLQPRSIAAGPARFPAAACCHHFLTEARPSRNTRAVLRSCVWEPTPQRLRLDGCQGASGRRERQPPQDSRVAPPAGPPTSSSGSGETQRSREGQGRGCPGDPRPSPTEEPGWDQRAPLAHSRLPLLWRTRPAPASDSSTHAAPGSRGLGKWRPEPSLIGHSARIPGAWGLSTQDTPKAERPQPLPITRGR